LKILFLFYRTYTNSSYEGFEVSISCLDTDGCTSGPSNEYSINVGGGQVLYVSDTNITFNSEKELLPKAGWEVRPYSVNYVTFTAGFTEDAYNGTYIPFKSTNNTFYCTYGIDGGSRRLEQSK
jgi:hypothetical protein